MSTRRASARRAIPLAVAVVVLASACTGGGRSGPVGRLGDGDRRTAPDTGVAAEPVDHDDVLAPPGSGRTALRSETTAATRPRLDPAAPPAPPLEPVAPRRPRLRIDGVTGDVLPQVLATDGVAFATVAALGTVELAGGAPLPIASVEPGGFRIVTPRVTADSPGVWDRLAAGDVVLDHPAARRLGLRPGDRLPLADGTSLTVGAVASHAEPGIADAVIAHPTADALDVTRSQTVLVAVDDGADAEAVATALGGLGLGAVEVLPDGLVHTARLVGDDPATVAAFAPFRYSEREDGRIAIDPAWVDAHIVTAQVPVLGEVTCHRELVAPLRAALQRLVDAGLASLLRADDYGGCFAPRHIDRSSDANLSMHAWGLAVDVNVSDNGLGVPPALDARVVEAFEAQGFAWGGRWQRPDGMHFELARLGVAAAAG